jgi:hypothetical protein
LKGFIFGRKHPYAFEANGWKTQKPILAEKLVLGLQLLQAQYWDF